MDTGLTENDRMINQRLSEYHRREGEPTRRITETSDVRWSEDRSRMTSEVQIAARLQKSRN